MAELSRQIRTSIALNERAHDLFISHNFAQQQLGFIHTLEINYGEHIAQRTMLEVEIAAAAKRKEFSTSHHKYIAKASNHLHTLIESEINKQIEDIDHIYHEVVGIQDAVPTILDILGVKSASVGRLEPLINELPWLGRELVSLVNLPQYRKQTGKGTIVKVDTPALALRYLGLENLQMVIPTFAMRHWMPHATDPFPLLKRKLREHSMTTAIAAKHLANLNGAKAQHAFTLGMLLGVGKVALTRLYLRTFERIWQLKVKAARDKGHKDLHSALLELAPDPLFLRGLLLNHSSELSTKLIDKMAFRYLPFNAAVEEFSANYLPQPNRNSLDYLPLSQVMRKAHGYSLYLTLKESQFVEKDEAAYWFAHLGLTNDELTMLAKCNFSNLQLTIL